MGNSNTEHSKQLRQEAANARLKRVVKEGGKRLSPIILDKEHANLWEQVVEEQDGNNTGALRQLLRNHKDSYEKTVANELGPNNTAAALRHGIAKEVKDKNLKINIVGFLASDDNASKVYADYTKAGCESVGIHFELITTTPEAIQALLTDANDDETIHGIFVYYPIWGDNRDTAIRDSVSPKKDVEGLTPYWMDKLYANERFDDKNKQHKSILPCTPLAVIKMLEAADAYHPFGMPFRETTITIFNRSEVVGKPLAYMLANDGGRVHSFDVTGGMTIDIAEGVNGAVISREQALQEADIIITGVPSKQFEKIKAHEIKPGAICLNFSYVQNFEDDAKQAASIYIPRVGTLTVAMCLRNALRLYKNYHQREESSC